MWSASYLTIAGAWCCSVVNRVTNFLLEWERENGVGDEGDGDDNGEDGGDIGENDGYNEHTPLNTFL